MAFLVSPVRHTGCLDVARLVVVQSRQAKFSILNPTGNPKILIQSFNFEASKRFIFNELQVNFRPDA